MGTYGHPWVLLHELCHLVADGDRLLEQLLLAHLVALLVRMVKDSFQFGLTLGTHDIPEVLLVALPTLVDLGRQVRLDLLSLREIGVEGLDRDLRVVADVDPLDISLEKQLLLAAEDHPNPLLGQVTQGRSVQLDR